MAKRAMLVSEEKEGLKGWTYYKENEMLVYYSNAIQTNTISGESKMIMLDVKNQKVVDVTDGFKEMTEIPDIVVENIKESFENSLKMLKLSLEDIELLMQTELDKKISEYDKFSTKEKLAICFPDDTEIINTFDEAKAEVYLERYSMMPDGISFEDLQEDVFLNGGCYPEQMVETAKNFIGKTDGTKLEFKNYSENEVQGLLGVQYDVVWNGKETGMSLTVLYDLNAKRLSGVFYSARGEVLIDSNELMDSSAALAMLNDPSMSLYDAYEVVVNSYEKPVIHNDCFYDFELSDETVRFAMIKQ